MSVEQQTGTLEKQKATPGPFRPPGIKLGKRNARLRRALHAQATMPMKVRKLTTVVMLPSVP